MSGSMLSDVELAILSLIAETPRFGAEIEQQIELRGLREWLTVGSASIYYILNLLEQQGLLSRTPGASEAVYQITDAGMGVIQTAVVDLLREPRPLGQGFALGLANCGIVKPSQVYRALNQHRDRLTHQLQSAEALAERRIQEESDSEAAQAFYSHGIALMRAELDWLTHFIDDWRVRHPAVEHDDAHDGDESTQTPMHRRTVSANRGTEIQKLKRPKAE